jgi:hypothetical protein
MESGRGFPLAGGATTMLALHWMLLQGYAGVLFIAALLAAAVLFVIYVNAVVLRTWYANRWGPIRRAEATVTRKATREYDRDVTPILVWFSPLLAALGLMVDQGAGVDLYRDWNFLITFQVGDKEMEFRVPEKLYVELEEGMQGVLTYRGERLLRFALGAIHSHPAAAPGGTPAMRDEAAPWTPGGRVARKP